MKPLRELFEENYPHESEERAAERLSVTETYFNALLDGVAPLSPNMRDNLVSHYVELQPILGVPRA